MNTGGSALPQIEILRGAMSRENVELVKKARALFQGNFESLSEVREVFSPHVEWRDLEHPPDTPPVVDGIGAMMQVWLDWVTAFPDIDVDIDQWIDAGDFVITVVHWHGRGGASGARFDFRGADLYEIREGKIVRATLSYPSKEEALEATGLSE
jgi:ketosteroid isomerase-like protein